MTLSPNIIPIREAAIHYTMSVLEKARDWQDGQTALISHEAFGPWLNETCTDEEHVCTECQSIIREAEARLGDKLPY